MFLKQELVEKMSFVCIDQFCLRGSKGERVSLVLGNCICVVMFVIVVQHFVVSMTS